ELDGIAGFGARRGRRDLDLQLLFDRDRQIDQPISDFGRDLLSAAASNERDGNVDVRRVNHVQWQVVSVTAGDRDDVSLHDPGALNGDQRLDWLREWRRDQDAGRIAGVVAFLVGDQGQVIIFTAIPGDV